MSFKLKHSGVPALMKTLTAGQKNMVQSMRDSGKTEAADKIKAGIEKAPIKKGPGDKRAKSNAKLKRDAKGNVVGTTTEKGGDQPIGTKSETRKMANRVGVSFNEDGSVAYGENKDMMKNLKTLPNGTVYGYNDPKTGKYQKLPISEQFNVREYRRQSGSHGEGLRSRTAAKIKGSYYDYNQKIDAVNRSSDKNSKIISAEQSGSNVRYNERKKEPKRTVNAAPRKLGVKGLAKKAAPKKRGVKALAKKAAPKKYGCKKKK